MSESSSDKILVRGVNWIGDAVMTLPALKSVCAVYADNPISLLVKPSVAPLFEKEPGLADIITYDNGYRSLMGRLRLSMKLRSMDFAKAILFQNAFDAGLLAFLAGIPERIGYDRDARRRLLTMSIPCGPEELKLHHVHYYLNLLKAAGLPSEYSVPRITVSLDERIEARRKLEILQRPILALNPGAAYGSAKRWFPERFGAVAERFLLQTGGSIAILGGKGETGIAAEIETHVRSGNGKLLNFAGRTELRELIGLVSESDLLLTNDSGTMHIGYAVGTPLTAVFGSTSPRLTGPPENGNVVIRAMTACSPCFERVCRYGGDPECMASITTAEVYDGIKQIVPERRAVFFDRDGTLCRDAHYLNSWDNFELLPGLLTLRLLKERGFLLMGVTNQSGIARGIVDEPFVLDVNRVFTDRYWFDDFLYCPHGPHDNCGCRKPEPGMMHEARLKYRINLKESFVVGDKDADMLLAKSAGAKGILVLTGQQKESLHADHTVGELEEAIRYILSCE